MKFVLGVDLGQANDPTALSIIELPETAPPIEAMDLPPYPTQEQLDQVKAGAKAAAPEAQEFHLRHLERVKLGTPYPKVVERIAAMLDRVPLKGACDLAVDATGVGRPVLDMMHDAGLDPIAVTITGGNESTGSGRDWRVPKRELVVGLQVLLQSERLKIAKNLPEAKTFVSELMAFKVKIDAVTAHDTYDAQAGAHDDEILSVAIACWWGKRSAGGWFI